MSDNIALAYEPVSIVGEILENSLLRMEAMLHNRNPALRFDADYIAHARRWHGGTPNKTWFCGAGGTWRRLLRFLNLGGPYTPPMQDSLLYPGADARSEYSLEYILTQPNIAQGLTVFLVPFALIASAPPYIESKDHNLSDFACFDCRENRLRPAVVAWDNKQAIYEYRRCCEDGRDPVTEIDFVRFTHPVADSFGDFLQALRDEPE